MNFPIAKVKSEIVFAMCFHMQHWTQAFPLGSSCQTLNSDPKFIGRTHIFVRDGDRLLGVFELPAKVSRQLPTSLKFIRWQRLNNGNVIDFKSVYRNCFLGIHF